MHKASIAELILTMFMPKDRASAIMGDLEEARLQKGNSWFWRSFYDILLCSGRRPIAAYFVSAVGGGLLLGYLQSTFFVSVELHDWTPMQRAWGSSVSLLSGLGVIIALYCSIRFGVRDILSKLAWAYASLGVVASALWWREWAVFVAAVLAIALTISALVNNTGRKGFGGLASVLGLQIVMWPLLLTLCAGAGIYLSRWPIAFASLFVVVYAFGAAIVCAACNWIHSWLLDNECLVAEGASLQ